jgi:hypothetical protein
MLHSPRAGHGAVGPLREAVHDVGAAIAIPALVFVFASYVGLRRHGRAPGRRVLVHVILLQGSARAAAAPGAPRPAARHRAGGARGQRAAGLSQEDVEAIPAFEYRRKVAGPAEQCAVCINVVRDGEKVRRLPACGHTLHAPCVDGWLRAHATCPMCRADVKVAAGEPPAEAAV